MTDLAVATLPVALLHGMISGRVRASAVRCYEVLTIDRAHEAPTCCAPRQFIVLGPRYMSDVRRSGG